MRIRPWIMLSLAVVLAGLAAGCGAKKDAAVTTTDSTAFATNPTEQGQGNLTPQQQAPPPEATKAPAPQKKAKTPTTPTHNPAAAPAESPGVSVPSGTALAVTVNTKLSTETAHAGDPWTGVVKDNVIVGDKVVIPAGSVVNGTISEAKPAKSGDRATLALAVGSIAVDGKSYAVNAGTEPIIAGSTRARNLGAIGTGAVAGALIGRAVGGSGKGALIGGLIGGAAAGGAVAKSQGYQVVLKEGTELTFTTSQSVAIKR